MAGSIYLPILSSFNPAGVNAAKQSLGGLSKAFDGVKRALGVASASFVAFKAVSETIDFGRSSVTAARDLERNLIGLDAVFGDLAPRMKQFAENGVDIGLSQVDAAKASTFLGSVLKQAGFDMNTVAGQTENLVGLATDLATTYGYDVSEALSGMTALFRGEYDPIEKFGVAMKQSEVNAILAANGQDKLQGAARRNAEQMARLALLYQRTQDAQGAFKEGSGTLFVEQQKLQAIFNNLQSEVGKALIPALVKVAEALQPLVKTLAPAITVLFTQFAGIITVLATQLGDAQSSLNDLIKVFGVLFGILKAILPFIIENAAAITTFIIVTKGIIVLTPIVQGLRVQFALLKLELAAGATMAKLFGVAMATSLGPLGIAAAAIGIFAALLVTSKNNLDKESQALKDNVYYQQKFNEEKLKTVGLESKIRSAFGTQKSGGFIASNYGVGAGGATIGKADKNAEDEFKKTLDDLLKNFSGATGAVEDSTKTATKATTKAAKEALKVKFAEFKAELKDLGKSLAPLAIATREIGQFEQATIDSFDAINKKLDAGVKDGTIGTKNLAALRTYLTQQNELIAKKAAERDAIVEKRNLAKTLIKDVSEAIKGLGSLGGLLEKETRDVTVATTKIVDGFTITTKRTVEEVIGGTGVLSKLQGVVSKTKAFAKQLTDLKALGLNENLFKQIVDAGPDVGGELAKEILAGGGDSVKALNTTFKELEDVAGSIAEQTAQVMYGAGVDVSKGLINGLLAEEAQIIAAAQKLADAFNAAYNERIMKLEIPKPVAVTPKTTTTIINNSPKVEIKATPDSKADAQRTIARINKFYASNSVGVSAAKRLIL